MIYIYIILGLIVLFFILLILFSFPQFSPIPYFPTNAIDLPLILKSLNIRNNQTIWDLGAGDGKIIFSAAKIAFTKKLDTKFVAVDINPVLIIIMRIRRLFHPNNKNIKIIWGDMFKMDYLHILYGQDSVLSLHYVYYIYLSPRFLDPIAKKIGKNPRSSIVSYMYPIPSLKRKEKIIHGKNKIFVYN